MKRRVKLGQHFLIDRKILNEIVRFSALKKREEVLEIGPGKGVLTEELLKKEAKVVAVEIDRNLVEILRRKFKDNGNLKIVNADILDVIPYNLQATTYKLVGNIPYQITSPLLRKIFKLERPPKIMILMVQKEVAERICAEAGNSSRGFLSVVVQYFSRPKILKIVPRESFDPMPKVESAIIRLNPKSEIRNPKQEERLFRLVQAGFSQKRKKLRNSLAGGLGVESSQAEEILQKAGIDPNLRAEDLSIKQWQKVNSMLWRPQ